MTNQYDYHRSNLPWLMWGLGAAYFFIMYIARVSPGVMSFHLMQDFHVNALALGSLVAFFYFPYVIMQIPVGIIIDRFGPRKILPITLSICAFAAFLFSQTTTLPSASLARLLLGFGSSFAFVGALKLASNWFPPYRIGLLAGLTQALGMLGAAVGEHPVALSVSAIGWRDTVLWMSGLFIILAVIIALVVRDKPPVPIHEVQHSGDISLFKGILKVLSNSQTWAGGIYAGMLFAPTAAFAELWGNSFLRTTYQLDMETAAFGIGLIFIGWGIGGPTMGWLSDKFKRRKPFMFLSAGLSCSFLLAVLYVPNLPLSALYALLFLYGITNTGVILGYALVAEANPRRVAGTSLGVANMLSIMLGTLFQPLIGLFLDKLGGVEMVNGLPQYHASHFQAAMTILPVCLILGFFLVFFIKETYCKPYEERVGQ